MDKKPKTTQEKRTNGKRCQNGIEEYNVKIRAKRSKRMLPDAWDDVLRGDYGHRSWKKHRKTKWKNN